MRRFWAERGLWAERSRAASARVRATRMGRAWARYVIARGSPLAGGIAYTALFSVVAGLALSYTAFMAVLGGNDELRQSLLDGIDTALPGVLDPGDGSGLVDPDALLLPTGDPLASIVAGSVLLVSALSAMGALRRSIRAMFGVVVPPEHPALGKVRDLVGFVIIAVAAVGSSVLGIAVSTAGDAVFGWLGIESGTGRIAVRFGGLLLALLVDAGVVVLGVRVLAGVRPPRRDLLAGALIAALANGVVRYLGAAGVIGASGDPLLASFATIVAVLVWFNVVARVVLIASAFIANPPEPPLRVLADASHLKQRPNYVTLSAPHTLEWPHNASTGEVLVHLPDVADEYAPAPTAPERSATDRGT